MDPSHPAEESAVAAGTSGSSQPPTQDQPVSPAPDIVVSSVQPGLSREEACFVKRSRYLIEVLHELKTNAPGFTTNIRFVMSDVLLAPSNRDLFARAGGLRDIIHLLKDGSLSPVHTQEICVFLVIYIGDDPIVGLDIAVGIKQVGQRRGRQPSTGPRQ